MSNLKKIFSKNYLWILVLILTIPTFYKLVRPGFFPMQDDIQAFRAHQMDRCFADFQIPCRWVPDGGFGYGYPQFHYYPPSVYYLGEIFHLLGFQFIDVIKILFILGFILSTIFMFLFLKELLGDYPAFVGASLYTYVPYKAVEVYIRGALNEFWSLVIFPLIFWASLKLIRTGKLRYLAFFALSIGLLLTTHSLMAIIFAPVLLVWILSLIILEKKPKLLINVFFGGLLGLGLASFFTFPVFLEREYAHLETLLGGYFDYRAHFADIRQLFLTNDWGYGSSAIDPKNELNLSTGVIHWVVGILALVLSLLNFKKHPKLAFITLIMGVVELGILFMIHQKSSFIWSMLPFLAFLQFPWRFLSVSIFLLSLLGALAVYFLIFTNLKIMYGFGIFIIIIIFVLHANFFTPKDWLNISDQDKFTAGSWDKQQTISIFDYLPIYAKFPPIKRAPEYPEVLEGNVNFLNYNKGSNFQKGELEILEDSRIRLPIFDFPGMEVWVDGSKVNFTHDDCTNEEFCLGLITFDIGVGTHKIEARLTNTPVRTVGNTLSLVSILILIGLFVNSKKHDKKTFS